MKDDSAYVRGKKQLTYQSLVWMLFSRNVPLKHAMENRCFSLSYVRSSPLSRKMKFHSKIALLRHAGVANASTAHNHSEWVHGCLFGTVCLILPLYGTWYFFILMHFFIFEKDYLYHMIHSTPTTHLHESTLCQTSMGAKKLGTYNFIIVQSFM